jgi:nucleotide-binding universal stress UspA family protein
VNLLLEEQLGTSVSIRNILFATDFSDVSEAALPYATALSLRYGGMVHVAHVLPDVTFLRPGAPDPAVMGSIYEDAHSGAQEKMQRLADRLRGFPHCTYLRHGKPSEVLAEIIRQQEVDLVVAGTHGRTGLGKLVMGSVAEEILRQVSCPVLTVGPRVANAAKVAQSHSYHDVPAAPITIRQVLCATDFRQPSLEAAWYAISLAREFHARLALLHVIEEFDDHLHERPGPIEQALRKLEALVPERTELKYPTEVLAEFGTPAELVLRTAEEREADVIVLGANSAEGRMGAATHLGGGVAHKVIVGAGCPVLTVRS